MACQLVLRSEYLSNCLLGKLLFEEIIQIHEFSRFQEGRIGYIDRVCVGEEVLPACCGILGWRNDPLRKERVAALTLFTFRAFAALTLFTFRAFFGLV